MPFLMMYGIPLIYGFILFHIPQFTGRFLQPCSDAESAAVKSSAVLKACANSTDMPMSFPAALDSAVLSGLIGIARLGGYMVFFNLLNIMFIPFHHVSRDLLNLYQCILEITSGINNAGKSFFYPILILLPFGGFSCIAQTYSMISRTDLSLRPYICHKLIQTAITAVCYLVICIL